MKFHIDLEKTVVGWEANITTEKGGKAKYIMPYPKTLPEAFSGLSVAITEQAAFEFEHQLAEGQIK